MGIAALQSPLTPGQVPPRSWDDYFTFLLHWEGENYENVPGDSGGPTKYGIDSASHPGVDIANLTARQASQLHLADYYKTAADSLTYPLNYAYFDFAMNAGEKHAAEAAQAVLGVTVDGIFGPRSVSALRDYILRNGASLWLVKFIAARELYYREIARWPDKAQFLKGWLNRSESCKTWCGLRIVAAGAGSPQGGAK